MKNILIGITGFSAKDCHHKIKEVDKRKINKVALFLSRLDLQERFFVYGHILDSNIEEIPMVHIRKDMELWELEFLYNQFKTRYFTIHQDYFSEIKKWRKFSKNLYLEFGLPLNKILKTTKMDKIGGFCIDLSHFKFEETGKMIEIDFIYKFKKNKKMFACNHLNGYDAARNADVHFVKNKKQLQYIKYLPKFIIGNVVGLEMDNSVKEQLRYKSYIEACLIS